MKINIEIEGTQRDLMNLLARIIANGQGYLVNQDVDLTVSRNSRSKDLVRIAEQIFKVFTGNTPDYFDEEDDQSVTIAPKLQKYMVFSGTEGLRVVEDLRYEMVAAMSERDLRHYWATTMFLSDEIEAKCVWANSPEQAIVIAKSRNQ